MLKRENRLSRILRKVGEKKYFSPLFQVRISENNDNKARFGFVVSKKIDKRATVRNRVKRQVRVCIENNLDKVKEGYNMLFLLKKQIVGKETAEVNRIVLEELGKQKLLK
jgi:ribonuclease P protein component